MLKLLTLKNSKISQSFIFIIFCLKNLCSAEVKKVFGWCAASVLLAKVVVVIQPLILGKIVDYFEGTNKLFLIGLISLFCLTGFVAALLLSAKNYFILIIREKISKDLSIAVLRKIQKFSHNYFHNSNISKISQINSMGLDALHGFMISFLSEVVPFLFELILIFSIIFIKFNFIVSLPVVIIFSGYVYISFLFASKEKISNKKILDARIALSSQFYENVINFENIKITHNEKQQLTKFAITADKFLMLAKAHGKLFWDKSLAQNIILYIGLFFILGVTISGVLHHTITAGSFVMLNTYFFQITLPLINVLRSYEIFNKSFVDIEPLMRIMQQEPDVQVVNPKVRITDSQVNFSVKNINFSYGRENVLENISFVIPAGHKISLVGETGSGKSTIAKLIMRFYDPSLGAITINDVDVKNIPFAELRSIVGFVPQDISLMHDTILNNITMGREDINLEDVISVTKNSILLDFVNDLEDGFATVVGDRGLKLSGGQRQRIGIVRALVRKPKLLILDEYNSSLDSSTENNINTYINPNSLNCSILLIAHRLNSVIDSNEIIVLKEGQIIQKGAHERLIQEKGWYQEAWEMFSQGFSIEKKPLSEMSSLMTQTMVAC